MLGIIRHSPDGPGPEGSVMKASFRIGTQTMLCTESTVKHDFSFTSAFPFFVECESEDEIRRLHQALVTGGTASMFSASYGFGRMFARVNDRYGVPWQLNLP